MCLTAEHLKAHVATEDIKCYKILQTNMKSYYHGDCQWEIGKLYETEMEAITRNPKTIGQAFHSYYTYLDAQKIHIHAGMPSIVVECTIPEGAMYFKGYHGYGTLGYASNQIIVNRVIPREELFPDFDFEKFPYKVGQKIHIGKMETIYQIKNIQPETQYKADLIVENCDTSICTIIRTVNEKGIWVGMGVELEILE